jgi:hypothetical protein
VNRRAQCDRLWISRPEGISAKAMKNGKEVALVIDSTGQVKEKGQDH